jgi:hypothetical protein
MDDHDDFFGDVFQDPEDDPLLGGDAPDDEAAGPSSSPDGAADQGRPSWITDEPDPTDDPASPDVPRGPSSPTDSPGPSGASERREIVVDQRADQGLDALNEAVAQGWRLIRISLAQADGPAEGGRAADRFVAILEPDGPQSLFDFGPGS